MKYFFDTEFIEKQGRLSLISIGIVSEVGETFYAVSDFDENDPDINPFVRERVLPYLGNSIRLPISIIAENILRFIGNDNEPVFYAYYADYDWVSFAWLFGCMGELPKKFPYYCLDFKQICYHLCINSIELFIKHVNLIKHSCLHDPNLVEHNALFDAVVLKACYDEVRVKYVSRMPFIL